MDAKKRERIDSQVMTALNRGITSRKSISQPPASAAVWACVWCV